MSANGTANGIVWVLTNNIAGRSMLEAFDATNVTTPIYTSEQAAGARERGHDSTSRRPPGVGRGSVRVGASPALRIADSVAAPIA